MSAKAVTKKRSDAPSFEQTVKRLEDIVTTLEEGSVPLDEALKLYEEGIALSRLCADKLKAAELRIRTLSKDAAGRFTLTDTEEA